MALDIASIDFSSPKRSPRGQSGWEGFFPYYAGFPETFAERILRSSKLPESALVVDPWNGSGTTTYVASRLGFRSIGVDINPVMALVARARSLSPMEHDSLVPLGREILSRAAYDALSPARTDPLHNWYGPATARWLRRTEAAVRAMLLSDRTKAGGDELRQISSIASTFYVALFTVAREVASAFRTSNPTWIRTARPGERRAWETGVQLDARFLSVLGQMASTLRNRRSASSDLHTADIRVGDTAERLEFDGLADLILTSPPYCTRIDYTAATRIELALLSPISNSTVSDLSRRMTGSVRVPFTRISANDEWGEACNKFLKCIMEHPSKASSTYYFQTHVDYFSKIYSSIRASSQKIRKGGAAIFVVQDSYYKDVHNDLPTIFTEMCERHSLRLRRREDFSSQRILAVRHPHTRRYRQHIEATEAVLCFEKL